MYLKIGVKDMQNIEQLRESFEENDLDALLVTNPFNRRYITGFTGTAGVALITKSDAFFITDFRYFDQASVEAINFTIVEHTGPITEEVASYVADLGISRLGFEGEDMTFALYKKYESALTAELINTNSLIETLRLIKTPEEIEILQAAAKIADDAYDHILNFIKPGVTEIAVANELEFFMRQQGATSSSFDIIVASGLRSALPHGVASNKVIESGELVTLDYGALYHDYISDITRTVAVGEINDDLTKIYETVLEAQIRGVNGIKPGMTGKEADALTRDYITEQGYGEYFGHSTGHGIGLEVHEGPGLSSRSDIVLKKNMAVTVEPGIYISNIGGCRIEDDIIITETGNERLTLATKELIIL